jgi:hypothetical protein
MNLDFPKLSTVGVKIRKDTVSLNRRGEQLGDYSINEIQSIELVNTGQKDTSVKDVLSMWFNRFLSPSSNYPSTLYYVAISFTDQEPINITAQNFDLIGVTREIERVNQYLKGLKNKC